MGAGRGGGGGRRRGRGGARGSAAGKSRNEWVLLHYDLPGRDWQSVHLDVSWLVVTGRLLDEMLVTWSRRADRMNLVLVEAPYHQSREDQNEWPFQSLIRIRLAWTPPAASASELGALIDEILRGLHYVVDFGASPVARGRLSGAFGPCSNISCGVRRAGDVASGADRGLGDQPDGLGHRAALPLASVHSSHGAGARASRGRPRRDQGAPV